MDFRRMYLDIPCMEITMQEMRKYYDDTETLFK